MNRQMYCLGILVIAVALPVAAADKDKDKESRRERRGAITERQETKRDIDKHVLAINRLDNNKGAKMAGLAMISKQTAVPVAKIEAEHRDHPQMGLAGLFMAHELAVKSHKPVEHFIKERKEGRSWTELARANNVGLDEIETKLSRVEEAMRNVK